VLHIREESAAVGEARSTTSVALMAAARETVETAATIIRMVEVPATTRAAGIAVERRLGAGSVVVLSWMEPAHLHAVLLHHVVATDRWTLRRMTFSVPGATQVHASTNRNSCRSRRSPAARRHRGACLR
jgi:hypothetical protein